jgi:RimJ/RimL family protein N-acetyltransferase
MSGPGESSKGYGTSIVRLLMTYVFQDLGLLKSYMLTFADNKAAIKHLEKLRCLMEGKLSKHRLGMESSKMS